MGRVSTVLERARLMLDRAEQLRMIADRLSQDDRRSLLDTIANELERRAKQIEYRAQHNLKAADQQQGYLPAISRSSGSGTMNPDGA